MNSPEKSPKLMRKAHINFGYYFDDHKFPCRFHYDGSKWWSLTDLVHIMNPPLGGPPMTNEQLFEMCEGGNLKHLELPLGTIDEIPFEIGKDEPLPPTIYSNYFIHEDTALRIVLCSLSLLGYRAREMLTLDLLPEEFKI